MKKLENVSKAQRKVLNAYAAKFAIDKGYNDLLCENIGAFAADTDRMILEVQAHIGGRAVVAFDDGSVFWFVKFGLSCERIAA